MHADLIAALADAVKACDPDERRYEVCDKPTCEARGKHARVDNLHDALARVCAALDLPPPGALRAEMEWELTRAYLADALSSAAFLAVPNKHPIHYSANRDEVYSFIREALALATEERR